MGNGSGLKPGAYIDTETSSLTAQDIEDAAAKAINNSGKPQQNIILVSFNPLIFMGTGLIYEENPQYAGTPWSTTSRMTKREHKVAKLHSFLKKLGVLKKIDEETFEEIKSKSIKRLKKAKWARYQKKA